MNAIANNKTIPYSTSLILFAIFGWFVVPSVVILADLVFCSIISHWAFYRLYGWHRGDIPGFSFTGSIFVVGIVIAWVVITAYRKFIFRPMLEARIEQEKEEWEHC